MRITARGSWTSGPEGDSGTFGSLSVFRLFPDHVEVVSHKEDALKD